MSCDLRVHAQIALGVSLFVCTASAWAQWQPLSLSGFNADIVVENTAVAPFSNHAATFDSPEHGFTFYESGLPGSLGGLPVGGAFTSVSDAAIVGQLRSYSQPNALVLTESQDFGSLSVDSSDQGPYGTLAIFLTSCGGGGLGSATVEFTDGMISEIFDLNAPDWYGNPNAAINGLGRVSVNTDVIDDGSSGNPRIYQAKLDLESMGYADKSVSAIYFFKPVESYATAIFGVSGARSLGPLGPVEMRGWNADVVVESSAEAPFVDDADAFDIDHGFSWYESGLEGTIRGMPAGGAFTSASNASITAQIAPYTGPNTLLLSDANPSGVLTFAGRASYNVLAIFASSTNGGGVGTLVLNFADGSASEPMAFDASDWYFNAEQNGLNNLGRINVLTDAVDDSWAGEPRIYQTLIDLASLGLNEKAVTSITFTRPDPQFPEQLTCGIFAVSGQVNEEFPVTCIADFNSDGSRTVQDLLAYLSAFRARDARADVDGNAGITVQDLLAFLSAFRAGCPAS